MVHFRELLAFVLNLHIDISLLFATYK